MGSIFDKNKKVEIKTDAGNTLDTVVDELKDMSRELLLQRKAQEEFVYGAELEDTELEVVDLEDVPEKEVDNG